MMELEIEIKNERWYGKEENCPYCMRMVGIATERQITEGNFRLHTCSGNPDDIASGDMIEAIDSASDHLKEIAGGRVTGFLLPRKSLSDEPVFHPTVGETE